MSKHNKHTKSHKKSKVKGRKRESLAARRLNELKIKEEANDNQN